MYKQCFWICLEKFGKMGKPNRMWCVGFHSSHAETNSVVSILLAAGIFFFYLFSVYVFRRDFHLIKFTLHWAQMCEGRATDIFVPRADVYVRISKILFVNECDGKKNI